jgi:hypothetical protein
MLFVGTTNQDVFLRDETGARRFWPVKVEGRCDIEALARDRDQLWAEAVARYKAGEAWHLSAAEEAVAAEEQEARFEVDPWEEAVLEYANSVQKVGRPPTQKVTIKEIMVEKFGWENPALWTQASSKRIGAILRRYGWERKPFRDDNGILHKGYVLVTPPTGNNGATGNTVSGNKNNVVTPVTPVTPLLHTHIASEKIEEDQKNENIQKYPLWENGVQTGNTGNRDDPPSPASPEASNKNNAVTDVTNVTAKNDVCLHAATTEQTMVDGSTLIRCTTCHRIVRVTAHTERT